MQMLPTYAQLIDDAMRKFIFVLTHSEPQFIAESLTHQLRKKALEIVQRTTSMLSTFTSSLVDHRLAIIRDMLSLIYQLVDKENEENVIVCLKIIIDYHRHLKQISLHMEVQHFMRFVKYIYVGIEQHMPIVYSYKSKIKVRDLAELNLDNVLAETYSSFQIVTEKSLTTTTATSSQQAQQQQQQQQQQQLFKILPRSSLRSRCWPTVR